MPSIDMHPRHGHTRDSSDESSDESKFSRFICYPVWKRRERSKTYHFSEREFDRRESLDVKMKEILDQLQYRSPTRPYNFDIRKYRALKQSCARRPYRDNFELNRFRFMRPTPLEQNPVKLSDLLANLLPFDTRLMAGILVLITSPSGNISSGYVQTHPLDCQSADTVTRIETERYRSNEELEHAERKRHSTVANHHTKKMEQPRQHAGYLHNAAKAPGEWAFLPREYSVDEEGHTTDATWDIVIPLKDNDKDESTKMDVETHGGLPNIGYFHSCF